MLAVPCCGSQHLNKISVFLEDVKGGEGSGGTETCRMRSFAAGMGRKHLRALVMPPWVPLCTHRLLPGLWGHWEAVVGLWGIS